VPLALGVLLLTACLFVRVPADLTIPARWNTLFYGILRESPSPEADLAEFGLEPGLARFVGTYDDPVGGAPADAPYEEVARRFGFSDVARFYLRHPDRLLEVASASARRAFEWRERILGNYTRDSGKPASAQAPSYTGWSDLEGRLFPRSLWFLASYFALFAGVSAWELRKGLDTPSARTAVLGLTVVGLAVVAFGVKVMAAASADPVKHLFLFQVLFDVSLFFSLAWIATRCEPYLPWGARPGPVNAPRTIVAPRGGGPAARK
jgi:hypothetical protein